MTIKAMIYKVRLPYNLVICKKPTIKRVLEMMLGINRLSHMILYYRCSSTTKEVDPSILCPAKYSSYREECINAFRVQSCLSTDCTGILNDVDFIEVGFINSC